MKNIFYLCCYLSMMATVAKAQVPLISSFSPTSGEPESVITITGSGFSPVAEENVVYFGPVKASVTSATETELNVIVPQGATGHVITVTVRGLTAYAPSAFVVTFPFSGNISGSFQNKTDLPVGYQMKWETVADIDGDGKTDIIFVDEGYGAVVILRNASTPGALTWDSFETAGFFFTGAAPYAVTTGDLDGDGRLDLIVANNQSSSISVMENLSSPGFVDFGLQQEFATASNPVFIAVRDIDLDGKQDVAVACNNNYEEGFITVLRNTATPGRLLPDALEPGIHFAVGNRGVWFVGLEDLDTDGKPEMIASSGGDGHVSIFKNKSIAGSISSESFEPKLDLMTGPYPAIVAIADLDGDSKPDMAVGNQDGDFISLFRNTTTQGIIDASSFENSGTLPSQDPWNTTAGDLDGDGKPELIVRRGAYGLLSVFKNKSTTGTLSGESFTSPYLLFVEGSSLGISVADLDNDGKSDLALSNEVRGIISVFRNEDVFLHSGPSGITFSEITGTSLSAHIIPSPDETDGYITLRRIGAFPNHPQDGVTYVDGQQIGDDVVAHIGPETSFEETGLIPGTDYFYRSYAYRGSGPSIDYQTARWAANVGFTIGPDLGPIVISSPETFSMDDAVTIMFDATRSYPRNALVGATSIRMRLGIVTDAPDGTEWHPDYSSIIDLAAVGDDKWTCTFIPRRLFSVPQHLTVYRIGMIFSDGAGHNGLSFDGKPIYLNVAPTVLRPPKTLPATFVSSSGFEASWEGVFDITEYYLDVSTSPTFDSFVSGYESTPVYGWEHIRAKVSGLAPETQYYYRVRVAGVLENSSVVSVITAPIPHGGSENIWVETHGGPGTGEIQTMTSDEKGNVYAAGHFTGTVTFGSITLHSQGEFDVFFVKYDKHGRVLWARSVGGPSLDNEVSLATDSEGLYMTAQFQGETDVDPGPGSLTFFNEGEWWVNDAFIAKYSAKDGSLLWAHKIIDAYGWSSSAIGVDGTGIYLSGHFFGRSDFDPSEHTSMLESQGDSDIFLAKYALNGEFIWARSMGGYYQDTSWGVTVDETGLYIHGLYNWQCDFDPGDAYYYLDNYGGFFGRYDLQTGDLVYAKSVGNRPIFSISISGDDLYLSGEIWGLVDADPDEGTHIIGQENFSGGIVGKYNLADGSFRWAAEIITTEFIGLRKIIADASGAYVNGYVAGSTDFQAGEAQENRTTESIDAFISRYRDDGRLEWVKTLGTPGNAVAIAATTTDDGYYLGGLFGNTVNFDPYEGGVIRTSAGPEDIFIAKYTYRNKDKAIKKDKRPRFTESNERRINVFPNPVATTLFIDCEGFDVSKPIQISILDSSGEPVRTFTIPVEDRSLDLSSLPRGDYFLEVRQHHYISRERLIKK